MTSSVLYASAFYLTAAVAVVSAFLVIWHRQPVICALNLAVCFFAVALIYVLLQAHFLAAIQILVYAGAVLVLFLMIVMLIRQDPRELARTRPTLAKVLGAAAVLALVVMMASLFRGYGYLHVPGSSSPEVLAFYLVSRGGHPGEFKVKTPAVRLEPEEKNKLMQQVATEVLQSLDDDEARQFVEWPDKFKAMSKEQLLDVSQEILVSLGRLGDDRPLEELAATRQLSLLFRLDEDPREMLLEFIDAAVRGRLRQMEQFGTTAAVGKILFSRYLLPFEAASILLLAAIVGVIVLARPGREGRDA